MRKYSSFSFWRHLFCEAFGHGSFWCTSCALIKEELFIYKLKSRIYVGGFHTFSNSFFRTSNRNGTERHRSVVADAVGRSGDFVQLPFDGRNQTSGANGFQLIREPAFPCVRFCEVFFNKRNAYSYMFDEIKYLPLRFFSACWFDPKVEVGLGAALRTDWQMRRFSN